ncbi:Card1-like endonuclease domain-containing protein [Nostoc sp.]|uniref:Card1-like endonuclease domain-containing protein n=1 Tax=Nostoc sp. TaxID=1180 RepID=UPI002FF926DD
MSTNEFEQYKVDHLFLLVGQNPLPNYVATKLLLHRGETAYLVHTTDTLDEAKRLKKSFESEFNVELRSLNHYESDAYHIQKEIAAKLKSINNGKIGLNYTGGTKAMSAHSYRTLFYEEIQDKTGKVYRRRKGMIFSYLDPRRLEICIDREDNERERLKVKPDTLQIPLITIFQLHGLNLKKNPTQQAQSPELAQELVKVFADKAKQTQWFDWYNKIFSQAARKDNRKWKNKTDLAKLFIPLDKLSLEIVEVFNNQQLLTSDDNLALGEVKKLGVFPEIEDLCKFLDGIWLEHYVLEQIKKIAHSQSILYYGLNFIIPPQGTKDGFEFDVAFTRGYQLFAISCTSDNDKKLCKSKLFEAYLRAIQMGGEEARVALVCCSDEPDTLKAEIADTLSNKKIAVFGRADLLNLSENIIKWIVDNDREAK